jgi:hypothetical protein
MHGYFLYKDHLIMIDVNDYYFKPMLNPLCALYKSKYFKILQIKTLKNEIKKEIDDYILLRFYKQKVDYYTNEQQILDSLPKQNGFVRFYYENGKIKERYFMKDGKIVEGTHKKYLDVVDTLNMKVL